MGTLQTKSSRANDTYEYGSKKRARLIKNYNTDYIFYHLAFDML